MKLSNEEKHAIEKISAIACKDRSVVKDVLKALLFMSTLEIYANINEDKKEIIIPYIGKIAVDWVDLLTTKQNKKTIKLESTFIESSALYEELKNISEGDITPSLKFIQKRIFKNISNILEVENEMDSMHTTS